MSEGAPSKTRARLLTVLKLVFTAAILTVVAMYVVPWRDQLLVADQGTKRTFDGRIEGEWRAERIRFVFSEAQPAEALPSTLRGSSEGAVQQVEVARDDFTSWRPGTPRVFRDVDPSGLAFALLFLLLGLAATAGRWWRLLRAAECPTSYWNALRLTFIGFFFNMVVPGLTGGDLVKAVMVARDHPERRAAAATSVLVDRLIGVLVLAALGAITIVLQGERLAHLRAPVLLGLGGAIALAVLYSNRTLRRAVGFDRLLARLPQSKSLQQIDEAVTIYSRRPFEFVLALAFSLLNQCGVMASIVVLGRSFGDDQLSIAQYVVVGSLGNIASAVPLTPGGLGVTETVYGQLFQMQGGASSIGIAVSLAWRLCTIVLGLFGGLFLLAPGGRMSAAERAALAPE